MKNLKYLKKLNFEVGDFLAEIFKKLNKEIKKNEPKFLNEIQNDPELIQVNHIK